MEKITIRKASLIDSVQISALISRNAKCVLSEEFIGDGLDFFLNAASEQSIREYMGQGFRYLVALDNDVIIGVIAIKDHCHMFHLFVEQSYHQRGIAKQLWDNISQCSIEQGNTEVFTLNSTTYALPVYQRWGFNVTGELQTRHGISYTPMELVVTVNA